MRTHARALSVVVAMGALAFAGARLTAQDAAVRAAIEAGNKKFADGVRK